MNTLDELKAFDRQNAEVTLWTFKGTAPKINGHWIDTTDALETELKAIFAKQLINHTEEIEYSLLAENNENSVLSIPTDETHADLIAEAIADQTPRRKTRDIKTIKNANFYVVKFVFDGQIVFCVKKTDSSWKTRSAKNIIPVLYKEKELDIGEEQGFNIHRSYDFFAIGDRLLVANKANFESVLSYRAAHEGDFAELKQEQAFSDVFTDLEPISNFVGTNRIHLRRMAAIRSKGFYADANFMSNLRNKYKEFGLNIIFNAEGNIVPTAETCRDIMTALLDHRLQSGFSGNKYDVPDARKI